MKRRYFFGKGKRSEPAKKIVWTKDFFVYFFVIGVIYISVFYSLWNILNQFSSIITLTAFGILLFIFNCSIDFIVQKTQLLNKINDNIIIKKKNDKPNNIMFFFSILALIFMLWFFYILIDEYMHRKMFFHWIKFLYVIIIPSLINEIIKINHYIKMYNEKRLASINKDIENNA